MDDLQKSTTKLYRETPCKHDYMKSHYICDRIEYPEYDQIKHTQEKCHCPGGSHEEVTIDYEVGEEELARQFEVNEFSARLIINVAIEVTPPAHTP